MRPNSLFATKSIDQLLSSVRHSHELKRTLGPIDLVLLGIGAIVGTGIFVLTGQAAAVHAGPAVILSFVIAGFAATFAGLCYAEMASMIPVSGSAYTYAYATMGELMAWIIGWDLTLEYLIGAATVSVGWSGYVQAFLKHTFDVSLPAAWGSAPLRWEDHQLVATGSVVNLPAVLITLAVTTVLVLGIRESARFNSVAVCIKIGVVVLFVISASAYVRASNWHPFVPQNSGTFGEFGISGIFQGATMVFVAYIGFDAVSTAAQETRNPQRDIPIGILGSLGICAVLYVLVAAVLTGVVPYQELAVPHPISVGIAVTGKAWLAAAVEVGAIAGLTSVILVMLMGQPRVLFAMAKDGLLPLSLTRVHSRFRTPYIATIGTGLICALAGGMLPIEVLGELNSVGTLLAFCMVCASVLILRFTQPAMQRPFRVPGGPVVVPLLGTVTSGALIFSATSQTMLRLFGWMAIGLVLYAAYGRRYSKLRASRVALSK
jgi:APA family basic amino acid/polyamine antiporter